MIFCHNFYNRINCAISACQLEKRLFSDAQFLLVHNNDETTKQSFGATKYVDDVIQERKEQYPHIKFHKFPKAQHQFGSLNGAFTALEQAYTMTDQEVPVVFSHDDIWLSDPNLFIRTLMCATKFGFVSRQYTRGRVLLSHQYVMLESFIIMRSQIPKLVSSFRNSGVGEGNLPIDANGHVCAEMCFGKEIYKNFKNPYLITITDNWQGLPSNQMGYIHLVGQRGGHDIHESRIPL